MCDKKQLKQDKVKGGERVGQAIGTHLIKRTLNGSTSAKHSCAHSLLTTFLQSYMCTRTEYFKYKHQI